MGAAILTVSPNPSFINHCIIVCSVDLLAISITYVKIVGINQFTSSLQLIERLAVHCKLQGSQQQFTGGREQEKGEIQLLYKDPQKWFKMGPVDS
jgi:hypothetical protein